MTFPVALSHGSWILLTLLLWNCCEKGGDTNLWPVFESKQKICWDYSESSRVFSKRLCLMGWRVVGRSVVWAKRFISSCCQARVKCLPTYFQAILSLEKPCPNIVIMLSICCLWHSDLLILHNSHGIIRIQPSNVVEEVHYIASPRIKAFHSQHNWSLPNRRSADMQRPTAGKQVPIEISSNIRGAQFRTAVCFSISCIRYLIPEKIAPSMVVCMHAREEDCPASACWAQNHIFGL